MDLEPAADLFYALLRAHLCDLIRCSERDPSELRAWFNECTWIDYLVKAGRVSPEDMQWCLAATRAKHGSRSKENISLYLAYKMSNSGPYEDAKRQTLLHRAESTEKLVLRELDGDELVGTYLNQEELCALVGKQVKFAREEEKILEAFDSENPASVRVGP
jgi:hypothetical protein